MIARLIASLVLLPSLAAAQERVSPELLLDSAVGTTTTAFGFPNGRFAGRERFLSRDRSIFQFADGQCLHGQVWIEAEKLCFQYEGETETHCWAVFRHDDRWLVRKGTFGGTMFEVTGFDETPLECAGSPGV